MYSSIAFKLESTDLKPGDEVITTSLTFAQQ